MAKFSLKLTSASPGFPVTSAPRTVIITDDDQEVGFELSTSAEVKAGQQISVKLTRTGVTTQPLNVLIVPKDLPGAAYTWQSLISPLLGGGNVQFAANQKEAVFTVTALLDGVLRPDVTIDLNLSTTAANTSVGTAKRAIVVKPTVGTLGFEQTTDVPVAEGANTIINIVRTEPTGIAADVDVSFVDLPGAANTWQDIVAALPNGGRYRFEPGESQISIVVQSLQDTSIRPDTKIGLKVVPVTPIFSVNTQAETTSFTVYNDDGTVTFEDASDIPLREGGVINVSVTRAGALTLPVDVRIVPSTVSGNETWQKLIAALPNNGVLRFNPGQLQAQMTISALSDAVIRPDSKVALQLVPITSTFTAVTSKRNLLVQNDDGSVGFDPGTELILNEGGEATVTLTRIGAINDPLDIKVSPQDLPAPPNVWQSLINPLLSSGNIHFDAGQTQATFKIKAIQDGIVRADTRFNLSLSTNQAGWTFASATRSVFVINDDTGVGFQDNSEIKLSEGSQSIINLVRTGNLGVPVEVKITPTDLAGASIGWQSLIHSLSNNGVVRFEAGQSTASITLSAIEDDTVRPDTRLSLVLSTTDTTVQLGPVTKSILVANNDQEKPGTFQFAADSVNTFISESAGKARLTVVRSSDTLGSVSLPWAYTIISGPKLITTRPADLVFAAGQTTGFIEIPLVNDRVALPDQVLSVTLGTPKTAGALLGSPMKSTLTILDDDPKPTFTKLAGRRTRQQLTSLDALFSDRLDPTSARKTTIWKVVDAGVDGLFGTTDDLNIGIRTAAYNAAAKKITLTFATASKSATPRNYQVSLNASGLMNLNKAPLSGTIVRTIKI
jgi:hypothetical protein